MNLGVRCLVLVSLCTFIAAPGSGRRGGHGKHKGWSNKDKTTKPPTTRKPSTIHTVVAKVTSTKHTTIVTRSPNVTSTLPTNVTKTSASQSSATSAVSTSATTKAPATTTSTPTKATTTTTTSIPTTTRLTTTTPSSTGTSAAGIGKAAPLGQDGKARATTYATRTVVGVVLGAVAAAIILTLVVFVVLSRMGKIPTFCRKQHPSPRNPTNERLYNDLREEGKLNSAYSDTTDEYAVPDDQYTTLDLTTDDITKITPDLKDMITNEAIPQIDKNSQPQRSQINIYNTLSLPHKEHSMEYPGLKFVNLERSDNQEIHDDIHGYAHGGGGYFTLEDRSQPYDLAGATSSEYFVLDEQPPPSTSRDDQPYENGITTQSEREDDAGPSYSVLEETETGYDHLTMGVRQRATRQLNQDPGVSYAAVAKEDNAPDSYDSLAFGGRDTMPPRLRENGTPVTGREDTEETPAYSALDSSDTIGYDRLEFGTKTSPKYVDSTASYSRVDISKPVVDEYDKLTINGPAAVCDNHFSRVIAKVDDSTGYDRLALNGTLPSVRPRGESIQSSDYD